MATFFEIHYYDSGLKTELVPGGGPRPELLPAPPGPKSTELELHKGEFAVELLCTSRKGHKIVWIGLYTFGIDRQHGARGNYCGVGVWLIDSAPVYVQTILNNLRAFASKVSELRGPSPVILEQLERAANHPQLGWAVPFDRWPHVLSSERFDGIIDGSTIYIAGHEDSGLDLTLVAADILHQFTRRPKDEAARSQRRLYLMRSSSKILESALQDLDYSSMLAAGEQAIFDFGEATAEPMVKQNALIESQKRAAEEHAISLANARSNVVAQTQRGDKLQAALERSEEQRSAMQETFAAVRQFTTDGNGAGSANFSARLDEIHRIVKKSRAKLDEIDRRVSRWSPPDRSAATDEDEDETEVEVWTSNDTNARTASDQGASSKKKQSNMGEPSESNLFEFLLAGSVLAAVVGFALWKFLLAT